LHSFVTKVDWKTQLPVWTQQLYVVSASKGAPGVSSAYGCSISHGQGVVYVAGVVKNGATLDYPSTKSAGEDDIFVAQLDTGTGHIKWLNQFGSAGHENLARNGGVATDMEGHAVVYGDTTGELYRARSGQESDLASDIFVLTLSKKDGSYHQSVESMKRKISIEAWLALLLAALVCGIIYYRRRRRRKAAMVKAMFQEESAVSRFVAPEDNDGSSLNGRTSNVHRPYRDFEPTHGDRFSRIDLFEYRNRFDLVKNMT
jgi:hypothetical protein